MILHDAFLTPPYYMANLFSAVQEGSHSAKDPNVTLPFMHLVL